MSPSLDGCPACGAPGLYAPDEGGEYAVEAGPVSSGRFRAQAVERLEDAGLVGLDPTRARALLANGRVRVAEGLDRGAADQLCEALGRRETQAQAVTGPRPRIGGGARRAMLTLAGLLPGLLVALVWTPLGGVALGSLLATILWLSARPRPVSVLGMLPIAPHLAHGSGGLLGRVFEAAERLDPADAERVKGVARSAFALYATLSREEHMAAQLAGGAGGRLGKASIAAVNEVLGMVRGTAGRALDEPQRTRLARLDTSLQAAASKLDALEQGGEVVEPPSQGLMDEEMAALSERLQELR